MPLPVLSLLFVALICAAVGYAAGRRRARSGAMQHASEQPMHDSLTGLPNRAALLEALGRYLALADRLRHPVTVLAIEIDGWPRIIEEFGAQAGPAVVQVIADRLRARVRAHDVLGRWSETRFLMVLPESDVGSALVLAQDLREALSQQALQIQGQALEVTISVGVHGRLPTDTERLQDHAADLAVGAERALEASAPDGPNRIGIEP